MENLIKAKLTWPALILMTILLLLGISLSASADTYNFFFSKKSHKKHVQPAPDDTEDDSADDEEEPAPPPPPAKKEETTRVEAEKSQAPIIINNTINNDNTNKNLTPIPPATIPVIPPIVAETPKPSLEASVTPPPSDEKPKRWRFMVSTVAGGEYNQNTTVGLELGIVRDIGKSVFVHGYTGNKTFKFLGFEYDPYAGVDLEVLPFRIPITASWDALQVGFLAGYDTFVTPSGNPGSFHIGARANLGLGPLFALTASIRANYGYKLAEAGLVCRF